MADTRSKLWKPSAAAAEFVPSFTMAAPSTEPALTTQVEQTPQQLSQEIQQLKIHLVSKDSTIAMLTERMNAQQNMFEKLSEQLMLANKRLTQTKDESRNRIKCLEMELKKKTTRITELEKKLKDTPTVESLSARFTRVNDKLKAEIDAYKTSQNALTDKIIRMNNELQYFKSTAGEQHHRLSAIVSQNEQLNVRVSQLTELNRVAGQKLISLSKGATTRTHMCGCAIPTKERRRPFINSIIPMITSKLREIMFVDGTNLEDLSIVADGYSERTFVIICVDIDTWNNCPDVLEWRANAKAADGSYNFDGLMIMPYIELMNQQRLSISATTEICMIWSILDDYVGDNVAYTVCCASKDIHMMGMMTQVYLRASRLVNFIEIKFSTAPRARLNGVWSS